MTKPVLVIIDPAIKLPAGAERSTVEQSGDRLRLADPDQPQINVTDLGVTRGDGIFEAFGVSHGTVQAVEPHLSRLARSAKLLDLPELDLDVIEQGVRLAAREHEQVPFFMVKLIVTRGIEGVEEPTAWALAFVGDDYTARQQSGVKVVTLDRGYRHDVAQTSPWLLQGAKTLSYAVNRAVIREAKRRGANEVIFISSDGYVLEGPNSTVILKSGDTFVTPRTDQGILVGTTQHALFGIIESMGYATDYRYVEQHELTAADGLWMVSSGQQISAVVELDGNPLDHDHELTQELLKRLVERSL
ncbi:4-amino-4-deoxychorismate lyase [Microlunatus endophyticus]|uniref:4-amino-4-deoxychorismate lyase n=1 Tax=Microlunatus endophyticus TaxID=1716077 RepID=A0A917W5C6_9ACTN|nr:aminotransferase class IV [Microlunatus endophyticus]GGL70206.1 4-amino-4-deoxychorismate lyase [Microlunatus endophyticus]